MGLRSRPPRTEQWARSGPAGSQSPPDPLGPPAPPAPGPFDPGAASGLPDPGAAPGGRHWLPAQPTARVLHLHGLGAHSGWFTPLGERLCLAGVEVVAPDLVPFRVGERQLPGPRQLRDRAWAALERFQSRGTPLFLAGTSLGACLALDLLARTPPGSERIAGTLLFAPAFRPIYLSSSETSRMLFRLLLGGGGSYPTPAGRGIPVVSDPTLLERLRRDPEAVQAFSARSHLHAQLLIARAWNVLLSPGPGLGPVVCVQGTEDRVVSARTNAGIFRARGPGSTRPSGAAWAGRSLERTFIEVSGGHHDLPWEPTVDRMDERLLDWMRDQGRTRD